MEALPQPEVAPLRGTAKHLPFHDEGVTMRISKESALPSTEVAIKLAECCYNTARVAMASPPAASEDVTRVADTEKTVRRYSREVAEAAEDPGLFSSRFDVTSDIDTSGDPQIDCDQMCHNEANTLAVGLGLVLLGEEDQFRNMGAEGPAMRGRGIGTCLSEKTPFAILDAIDGTHQFAGMYQRGAFASAVMTLDPLAQVSVAIALGTGDLVSTNGQAGGVWQLMLADPLDDDPRELDGAVIARREHHAVTWVIPSFKLDRLDDAARIKQWAVENSAMVRPPDIIAPLGGNAGIISSMVLAPAGAVAAYQPKSWAWDQLSAFICVALGFTVLSVRTGHPYSWNDLRAQFLRDLTQGNKTEALITGKSPLHARTMRSALLGAKVLDEGA